MVAYSSREFQDRNRDTRRSQGGTLFMISRSSRTGTGTGILLEARRAVSSYRYDGSSRTGTGILKGGRDASLHPPEA